MKRIFEKINFRQPKYMLPAILYIPLLGASYFIFDLFNAEKAEIADKTLQTTEFLNPDLPDATIKGGDGIGSKYENMAKSWGKIADYTAVDNIERDEPNDDKEKYESQYSQDEVAFLGELEQQNLQAEEAADAKAREQEALKELERALALVLEQAKSFRHGYRNVVVLKKMTFPNDKVLTIELSEKQISGRTISLSIDYEDVLSADSFNHILLEEE